MVVSPVLIANRGGGELVIGQIRSSCACGVLEQVVDGKLQPVGELRLKSGETAELVIRTTVRTVSAGDFQQSVSFATNDPSKPEGKITIVFRTLTGGVRLTPSVVQFGRVPLAKPLHLLVEVRDKDRQHQTVSTVTCANPELVSVRWIPADGNFDDEKDDRLLGRIELTPATGEPHLLDTTATIDFVDPKIQHITLPITGRVVPRLEASPEALILPLSSSRGPIYTGVCSIRANSGEAIEIALESASPELAVDIRNSPGTTTSNFVRVTWVPTAVGAPGVVRKSVKLRIKVGGRSELLEISVNCDRK